MIRYAFCSELHTSVDEAFGSFEFPIKFEFEIAKGFLGSQEVVFFLSLGEGAGGKSFVFDAPNGFDITFPAFEGFAIEECFGGLSIGDRGEVDKAQWISEQE